MRLVLCNLATQTCGMSEEQPAKQPGPLKSFLCGGVGGICLVRQRLPARMLSRPLLALALALALFISLKFRSRKPYTYNTVQPA